MSNRNAWIFTLALLGTFVFQAPLFAQSVDSEEAFDKQSPEEILRARMQIQMEFANAIQPEKLSLLDQARILGKYDNIDPKHEVPSDLLQNALMYFDVNKDKFPNQGYITIVDFSPRSDRSRFYLINMADGSIEKYHTTHGKGSDPNKDGFATVFGNVINSGMSSLGYVRTAEVYSGKYKVSVRLDGLSDTNSNIRERSIVFHGWDDVHERDVIQGLSWGCITLDWKVKDPVLEKIKEGSLMYVGVSKTPKLTSKTQLNKARPKVSSRLLDSKILQ